ncbi:hypothetical protein CBM2594_A100076 [Cupriavidus taiwanensis]|uniref:Uncharacterized protein n=1 Tax=Cupriavidus taiwanensis TaxID=164546 RepID=A0A7Z7J765_9BURK|nr:hypothetical protein CBM2594_A100076 [Cupriavidus taiwanensis]
MTPEHPTSFSPLPLAGEGRGRGQELAIAMQYQKPPAQWLPAIHTTSLLHTPALSPNPSPARGRGEQTSGPRPAHPSYDHPRPHATQGKPLIPRRAFCKPACGPVPQPSQ